MTAADLHSARRRFRDARRDLASAALAGDDGATVAAARRLLRAYDRVTGLAQWPTNRDRRTWRRWRRWALAALRFDPPAAGFLLRARRLHTEQGDDDADD